MCRFTEFTQDERLIGVRWSTVATACERITTMKQRVEQRTDSDVGHRMETNGTDPEEAIHAATILANN